MIRDVDILKLMLQRHNFENYRTFINDDHIQAETRFLLGEFKEYYARYSDDHIDMDKFISFFFHIRHPELPECDKEINMKILTNLHFPATNIGDELLTQLKVKSLSDELMQIYKTTPSIDKLTEALDKHTQKEKYSTDNTEFVDMDITSALADTDPEVGYHWRLSELSQTIGLVSPWTFGIVAAATNSGKSSFLVSEMSYLCQQLAEDECILWLNNENKGVRILPRLYQAMFNITRQELESNPHAYAKEFNKRGGNKIKILDIQKQTNRYVEKLVRQLKPRIILIDMLDHVYGISYNRNETQEVKFEKLYQWALELACVYNCTVIGTSQLNAHGTVDQFGKLVPYPKITNLKGSQGPSKQGAASWVLMIGRADGQHYENTRFMSAPKSKFGDDTYRSEVHFDREKGLFISGDSPWSMYEKQE